MAAKDQSRCETTQIPASFFFSPVCLCNSFWDGREGEANQFFLKQADEEFVGFTK